MLEYHQTFLNCGCLLTLWVCFQSDTVRIMDFICLLKDDVHSYLASGLILDNGSNNLSYKSYIGLKYMTLGLVVYDVI